MMNIAFLVKCFVVMIFSLMSNTLAAEETMIKGSAFYLERIALPPNAVFEATLEDVSLMDVRAPVLGNVIIESVTSSPINFSIRYNANEIKPRHSYNVRGKITANGQLIFVTDTAHAVLTGKNQEEIKLRMRMVRSIPVK